MTQPCRRPPSEQATQTLGAAFDTRYAVSAAPPSSPADEPGATAPRSHYSSNAHLLPLVEKTLESMARGGIYDHLGGGFHRYSTDAQWLVPHFEKMLYDNAQLVCVYLHAYQLTGKELYRRVVEEVLAYVEREMTDPAAGSTRHRMPTARVKRACSSSGHPTKSGRPSRPTKRGSWSCTTMSRPTGTSRARTSSMSPR